MVRKVVKSYANEVDKLIDDFSEENNIMVYLDADMDSIEIEFLQGINEITSRSLLQGSPDDNSRINMDLSLSFLNDKIEK